MALPPKKTPRHRTRTRRAHHALTLRDFTSCSKCGQPIRPHTVCPHCGTYKGRQVIKVTSKAEKRRRKERKQKETAKKQGASQAS